MVTIYYLTFEKQNKVPLHILINSIQVGGYSVRPQAVDQGNPCFIKLWMFAPHKSEAKGNQLSKFIFTDQGKHTV